MYIQSGMDNPETQATLGTRNSPKTNYTCPPPKKTPRKNKNKTKKTKTKNKTKTQNRNQIKPCQRPKGK